MQSPSPTAITTSFPTAQCNGMGIVVLLTKLSLLVRFFLSFFLRCIYLFVIVLFLFLMQILG